MKAPAAICPDVKPAQEGCQEIDGYIIDIFDGSAWLTRDLKVTPNWNERGVWATVEEAKAAMKEALT